MEKEMNCAQALGEDLLTTLRRAGWQVQYSAPCQFSLPSTVQQRYQSLPQEVTAFLGKLKSCTNAEQTVWFLCPADFARTDPNSFRWNFQELLSLEAAEGDAAWQAAIRRYWDSHFPFMMAVHSDYDYLAVSLEGESYGAVVHGFAPEFESGSLVAPSFSQFLADYKEVVGGHKEAYPLGCFL
jgi:hypothetical protein